MPTTQHKFNNGQVTLWSDLEGFPEKTVAIGFTLDIAADGGVGVSDFQVDPITDIEASGRRLDLQVALLDGAQGQIDTSTGELRIHCVLEFVFTHALLGFEVARAQLHIEVQTGQATMPDGSPLAGSPVAKNGDVTLVALGHFTLAPPVLEGVACSVQLVGTLLPSPRT